VLIDSHCHLFMPEFAPDTPEVLTRAQQAGVTQFVVVGYDLESSRAAVRFAHAHPDVFACVAIHPHHADQADPDTLALLRTLAADPRVVAVGEIGLDYYRNLSPRAAQAAAFRDQLALASAVGLPVVIHDREAHEDTMRTLAEGPSVPAVILHCFSGDQAMAQAAWARGYYTGIGGPLTYPNAEALRAVFRDAPRDRVLLETDAPYLPPAPHRGRRNEPAYLPLIAGRLAALWQVAPEAVAEQTSANTRRAFALGGGR
jgi:TatD DNase family protein